ncbi:AAA family ATPase [bacterium]|nr:AAA family ATPase [candidate division CSSED10-310 bacterium]
MKKKQIKSIQIPPKELTADQLRWHCPEDLFDFKGTRDLKTKTGIIGQHRAIRSIKTGLEIKSPGYNIFVSGLTGTGRSTTVQEILKDLDRRKNLPDDKLYVNNFKDEDQPRLIRLPAGQGKELREDMGTLVELFRKHLPGIFESKKYKRRIQELTETYQNEERELFQTFEKTVSESGFTVVRIQMGNLTRPDLMPSIDGKPVPFDELENSAGEGKFDPDKLEELKKSYNRLKGDLDKILAKGRDIERRFRKEVEKSIREFGLPHIEEQIEDLRARYKSEAVNAYLNEIRDYTLDNIDIFLKKEEKTQPMALQIGMPAVTTDPFRVYMVNLVVDNSGRTKTPAIVETAPNYKNLFGAIEKVVDRQGNWVSDFMNIKAGSILRAEGGYLVINLLEAVSEPFVWQMLKRTLKYGQLEIENPEVFFLMGQTALKPEAVKLDLKVVLIGDKRHYLLLYNYDEDFKKIFKICADFNDRMDRNDRNILDYACFVKRITENENLPSFSPSGVAAVVEESVRMADRQDKLSSRFSDIADLVREASYWMNREKGKSVNREHIDKAVEERVYRRNLIEERIREYIRDGLIMIDTAGEKSAQINGLAIYDYGEFAFGKPAKITATVSLGKEGIINIEREAELSGKIHDKGIQILSGFLRNRFAQDKPLTLSASICFEQSYGGIDGDSASSTELYLLLSTLAQVPIRQFIAVTGSVNQQGEIQPIGGVNQKIEGFYDVCRLKRLTGKQGVIIPRQNVKDLQLRKDVVETVNRGRFHIWAVETVDEGIEILTGVKAGKRNRKGVWETGTLNYLVNERLKELATGIQKFYQTREKPDLQKGDRPSKEPRIPPPPRQPTRQGDEEGGND